MRSKTVNFIFVVLSVCFCACNQPATDPSEDSEIVKLPIVINVERDYSNTREFRLSEIVDNIEYVRLEKNSNCMLGGGIPRMTITQDYIFMNSMGRVFQFKRDGTFMHQIGRKGKGPGEFLSSKGIVVNREKNTVHLIANYKNKVLIYNSIDGEFIGSVSIDSDLGNGMLSNNIISNDDGFITLSSEALQFTDKYKLVTWLDWSGKKQASCPSSLYSKQLKGGKKRQKQVNNRIWRFNNEIRLFECLNDTIYSIEDFHMVPKFVFELGDKKDSFDEITSTYINTIDNFFYILKPLETNRYLLFTIMVKYGQFQFGGFDKTKQEYFNLENAKGGPGVINDVDGGLNVLPVYINETGSEWASFYDAVSFKEKLNETHFQNSESRFSEKKKKLMILVDSINIEDNPIVMIMKLKD